MDAFVRTGPNWRARAAALCIGLSSVLSDIRPSVAQPAPPDSLISESDRGHFREALRLALKGQWKQARDRVRRAGDPLPRKIVDWMAYSARGTDADFNEIAAFIRTNPDWPGHRRLQQRAEEAIDGSVSPETVIRWFEGRQPLTGPGMATLGQALIAAGRIEDGAGWLRRAWVAGGFTRREARDFARRHRAHITEDDRWARIDNLLWSGRTRAAQAGLQEIGKDLRAVALARIRLRRNRGGVDWAIRQVPPSLQSDPGFVYERFRWRVRKRRDDDALAMLPPPGADLRRPEIWVASRMRLARRLLGGGRVTDAWRVIKDHNVPPEFRAPYAEAEWLAGWVALRFLNENNEAFRRFEKLYGAVRYPVSRARAAYWAGRAAQAAKNPRDAVIWFRRAALHPTTYHGQLAALQLGETPRLPTVAASPTLPEAQEFRKRELVRAVLLLDRAGQDKRLRPFMLRLGELAQTERELALIGQLAREIGRPDLGVWVSRHAQRRGIVMLEHGYPLVPMPDGGPERALLLAVSRQESNFDPRAISHAGARGMMQLMPATARGAAQRLQIGYSRSRLISDHVYNVRLGRYYLNEMINRFNGSYVLSIASYNAGPHNVGRWLRRNGDPREGGVDPIDWIELIPFNETRDYVQRVLGNLQVFRHRLQAGKAAVTLKQDLQR